MGIQRMPADINEALLWNIKPYPKALLLQCSAAWQLVFVMHALTFQQAPAWLQPHLQFSPSS